MKLHRVFGCVGVLAAIVACGSDATDEPGGPEGSSGSSGSSNGGSSGGAGSSGTSSSTSSGGSGASSTSSSGSSGATSSSSSGSSGTSSSSGSSGVDCSVAGACTGTTTWALRFGNDGTTGADETAYFAVEDAAGNRYVTGTYRRTFDLGPAGILQNADTDAETYVVKLDPAGQPIWARALVSKKAYPSGIGIDELGNITIGGLYYGALDLGDGVVHPSLDDNNHAYVASWSSDGTLRYGKVFGEGQTQQSFTAVAVAPNGFVTLAGSFDHTLDLGGNQLTANGYDVFVARFDGSGNHVWSRRFGDDQPQGHPRVGLDAATGEVFVATHHYGTIDFGGGPLVPTVGSIGAAVARLRSGDGGHVWSKDIGEAALATSVDLGITIAPDGDLALFSYFGAVVRINGAAVNMGPHAIRIHADGTFGWAKSFAGTAATINGAAFDSFGNLVMTGSFQGTLDLGSGPLTAVGTKYDVFFAKLSPTGAPLWARAVGDSDQHDVIQIGEAVTIGSGDVPTIYGTFYGALDFGTGERVSGGGYGGSDVFVAELAP